MTDLRDSKLDIIQTFKKEEAQCRKKWENLKNQTEFIAMKNIVSLMKIHWVGFTEDKPLQKKRSWYLLEQWKISKMKYID